MLKEYLQTQQNITSSENPIFQERKNQSFRMFKSMIHFLRDKNNFPNQEINQLAEFTWKLIDEEKIKLGLDNKNLKTITMVPFGEKKGVVMLPDRFINQVNENPFTQFGKVIFQASRLKDYYTGKMEDESIEFPTLRASAYEAEALLTLQKLAETDNLQLPAINEHQASILKRFPNGLADLTPELKYST